MGKNKHKVVLPASKDVTSDSEVEDKPLKSVSSSSDSEEHTSNIVYRTKVDKSILENTQKKALEFSDSDSGDISNIKLTVNKKYEEKFEKKAQAKALSKENQRILSQLQRQIEIEEKQERRAERKALQAQKREEAERKGIEYLSEDDDSESSEEYSSEDETGKLLTPEIDSNFFETLVCLRKKDPKIYDKNVKFFKDLTNHEEEYKKKEKKKEKLTLGKLVAQQAANGDAQDESSSEDSPDESQLPESFFEEQARLKKEFIETLRQQEDSDEELFSAPKSIWDPTKDEEISQQLKTIDGDSVGIDNVTFLEKYLTENWWKNDAKVPSVDKVLGTARSASFSKEFDVEADDEADVNADRFEAQYNFRFMEDGADEITSYPRSHLIDNSVRQEANPRREARLRKVERKQLERQQKLEEIRRLKNVKKQALEDRIKTISLVAGIDLSKKDDAEEDLEKPDFGNSSDEERELKALKKLYNTKSKKSALTARDLAGDFDPAEHDKLMARLFDDEFYSALGEDKVEEEGKDLENTDALELLDQVTKDENSQTGNKHHTVKSSHEDDGVDDDEVIPSDLEIPSDLNTDNSDLDDQERAERRTLRKNYIKQHKVVSKSIKKQKEASKMTIKKSLQSLLETGSNKETESWWKAKKEELLQNVKEAQEYKHLPPIEREKRLKELLDKELEKIDEFNKEDVLQGTRFRYKQVKPALYGLELEDIFNFDDKELNRRVGMKRLAPYREDDEDIHWKQIQDKQKAIYREYMDKQNRNKQEAKKGKFTHTEETPISEDVSEVLEHRKKVKQSFTKNKPFYPQDISQGLNRQYRYGSVNSSVWYKSKNNFTIPEKPQGKHVKFSEN